MVGFNHHFPYHCWVTESCLTLAPPRLQHVGLPCPHLLLEFAQTRVHWVSDVILPSHPLLPPSALALSLSQHRSLFQWVTSSQQVAKILQLQLQHQSFQWLFRTDYLQDWLVWYPCIQGTLKSLRFLASILGSSQPSLWPNSHTRTWLLEQP